MARKQKYEKAAQRHQSRKGTGNGFAHGHTELTLKY
jgi:hypothetical protein